MSRLVCASISAGLWRFRIHMVFAFLPYHGTDVAKGLRCRSAEDALLVNKPPDLGCHEDEEDGDDTSA